MYNRHTLEGKKKKKKDVKEEECSKNGDLFYLALVRVVF